MSAPNDFNFMNDDEEAGENRPVFDIGTGAPVRPGESLPPPPVVPAGNNRPPAHPSPTPPPGRSPFGAQQGAPPHPQARQAPQQQAAPQQQKSAQKKSAQPVGPPKPNRNVAPPPPPKPQQVVSAPGAGGESIRVTPREDEQIDLDALLAYLVVSGSSDLHLSAGAPPMIRISGDVSPVKGWPRLTGAQITMALNSILNERQRKEFGKNLELDFAYTLPDGNRFRGNIMREREEMAAVFRAIPSKIIPLDALNMPEVLYNFAALPRGLVLVTGPTGSGKSTTLAAMIDQVNRTRRGNIITVEDPIEFLHPHRSCIVRQREVGADTWSFAEALKHVLRQDPDIILVGELRDLETISIALTAAETGHLVFATLHTQSASETVSRIIDVFPSGQQSQIRSQLASTLKGVVCQALVKRADGQGRIASHEIMVVTNAIATQIRRDETHQIPQSLQSGAKLGMHSFNQHLAELVHKGLVTRESAEEVATDLKDLAQLIEGQSDRASGVTSFGTQGGMGGSSLSGGGLSGASS